MDELRMTRKSLLSAGALAASALVLGVHRAQGALTSTGAAVPRVIDVHGHALTPAFEQLLREGGDRRFEGAALPTWDAASAIAWLDRQGIDLQLLSTPDPALTLVRGRSHVAAARALYDELAAVVAGEPGRFGMLAVLPLHAGAGASLAELRRVARALPIDGVVLPTTVAGRLLGDPVYLPVLAELSRRRIPALVHPVLSGPQARPDGERAATAALEQAFSSVRCAASLLYGGAFVRAPNLRLVFAGGGGGLPFVASRVALADQALRSELFIRPLRRLSFDLADSTAPGAVASLRAFVRSPGQLLYGSNWPLTPEPSRQRALDLFAPGDREVVGGAAARAVFRSLSTP